MKTRNPIIEIRLADSKECGIGTACFFGFTHSARSFQTLLGVAASRQSAANFLFLSKKCGALPRRRYAVLEKALMIADS